MPEKTPRLGLDTYAPGEEWDHTDTVETVDEHAIVHGAIADRPATGDYDDELFHATDQEITWRWDATSSDWEYFSGQGSSSQPVPGTGHYEAVRADTINNVVWVDENYGGATDIGAALNNAINEHGHHTKYKIAPGTYTQTTSIDGTDPSYGGGLLHCVLDFEGVDIHAEISGEPIIDTTASRNWTIRGGVFTGDDTITPSCGILMAREETGRSVGISHIDRPEFWGSYEYAALFNYGSEEGSYHKGSYRNDIGRGIWITRDNAAGITSPHVAMATGAQSTNDHIFYGSGAARTDATDVDSAAIYLRGADSAHFDSYFVMSAGDYGILADTTPQITETLKLDGVRFHMAGGTLMGTSVRIEGGNDYRGVDITPTTALNSTGSVLTTATDTMIRGMSFQTPYVLSGDAPQFNDTITESRIHMPPGFLFGNDDLYLEMIRNGTQVITDNATLSQDNRVQKGSEIIFKDDDQQDLSLYVPVYDGQIAQDDGTNFTAGERAYADTTAGVWRAYSDPLNKTVAY